MWMWTQSGWDCGRACGPFACGNLVRAAGTKRGFLRVTIRMAVKLSLRKGAGACRTCQSCWSASLRHGYRLTIGTLLRGRSGRLSGLNVRVDEESSGPRFGSCAESDFGPTLDPDAPLVDTSGPWCVETRPITAGTTAGATSSVLGGSRWLCNADEMATEHC
eukprot:1182939-Prorocentrum_minimum.AAC.3